jgi:outer membrane protein OmpA-like peptidoglycan-associated protein
MIIWLNFKAMKKQCFFWLWLLFSFSIQAQRTDTFMIYFPFDQSQLTSEAQKTILEWQKGSMSRMESMEIRGHCDALGSHIYNDELSKRRTQAVKQFLIKNGLPDSKITLTKGFGKRMPLNQNLTVRQRQQNRRVEIILQSSTKDKPVGLSQDPIVEKDTAGSVLKKSIDKVQEGQTIRLRNINFYGGRHTFLSQSYPALQELLDVMKTHPTLIIEIQGHICCRFDLPGDGDDYDAGDKNLSYNRARAVYRYLSENGIDPDRMSYKGFGAKVPLIYPEYTDADRTLNRRVEIKIIKR